jgi:hypothetical protein
MLYFGRVGSSWGHRAFFGSSWGENVITPNLYLSNISTLFKSMQFIFFLGVTKIDGAKNKSFKLNGAKRYLTLIFIASDFLVIKVQVSLVLLMYIKTE